MIWLDGWFVYYNFLKPYLSLKGKTSAEACGINLKIKNSWEDLIKEAILSNFYFFISPTIS